MTIEDLRRRVDVVDEQIVALLNVRAASVIEIGRLKKAQGVPIYQAGREQEVLQRVRDATTRMGGALAPDAIARLFERIIDEARALEARVSVGGDGACEPAVRRDEADRAGAPGAGPV